MEKLCSQQKQDQELTGSDHELFIAKFRLKLKKVGKTTEVQPRWIQGDSKVGTESASLEMTYLITDRKGLED